MDYDVPKPPIVQQIERPKAAGVAKPRPRPNGVMKLAEMRLSLPAPTAREHHTAYSEYLDYGGYTPEPPRIQEEKSGQNIAPVGKIPSNARDKKPLARGRLKLASISDQLLADVVRGLVDDFPDLEARILDHARIKDSFAEAAAPAIALPTVAPRLWANRPEGERGINAAGWIRNVYAPWLGHGLARHHVGELDPELGRAYSNWTRKDRHPEDIIHEFAEGNPYGRLDDAEAGRRHRAGVRASQAKKAAKLSQPTTNLS